MPKFYKLFRFYVEKFETCLSFKQLTAIANKYSFCHKNVLKCEKKKPLFPS